jgi:hypothetical protein
VALGSLFGSFRTGTISLASASKSILMNRFFSFLFLIAVTLLAHFLKEGSRGQAGRANTGSGQNEKEDSGSGRKQAGRPEGRRPFGVRPEAEAEIRGQAGNERPETIRAGYGVRPETNGRKQFGRGIRGQARKKAARRPEGKIRGQARRDEKRRIRKIRGQARTRTRAKGIRGQARKARMLLS